MRWLRGTAEATRERGDLAPIRIFADEIELIGFVAPTGQRITDMLLRGQDLAFLPRGADPEPANWVWISSRDIVMVVPPPLVGRRAWPEPRDLRSVSLRVAEYRVHGTMHLVPGDELGVDLRRRQPFLPLTAARVESPARSERFDVVIVNTARARVER